MDPFTQGLVGAAVPQSTRRRRYIGIAGGLGFLSGMAADLDILIRSPSDPLMFLEYHRQFTHSVFFIPVGGLLVALVLHFLVGRRWKLGFAQTALFCTLGYATHALLDAATSYGTMLLWPLSHERFAWKIVSVIDPLFTAPLAALVATAWFAGKAVYARLGLIWVGTYLALGVFQHQAALDMARQVAASRGHTPIRLDVKPSFGNIVVWKTLYETGDRFHVDAVRASLWPKVFAGQSVAKLDLGRDLPWLKRGSQQAEDIARFGYFSDGFIAIDPKRANRIIDVRYSLIPNRISALWSIEVSPSASDDEHVRFQTHRDNSRAALGELWEMIRGAPADLDAVDRTAAE